MFFFSFFALGVGILILIKHKFMENPIVGGRMKKTKNCVELSFVYFRVKCWWSVAMSFVFVVPEHEWNTFLIFNMHDPEREWKNFTIKTTEWRVENISDK